MKCQHGVSTCRCLQQDVYSDRMCTLRTCYMYVYTCTCTRMERHTQHSMFEFNIGIVQVVFIRVRVGVLV
jgi:hypothetical protein